MAAGVGAHSSVTRWYIMLQTHSHTHTHTQTWNIHCHSHTPHSLTVTTHTCTHSHTEYQIRVKLLDSEPHVKSISSVKHCKSLCPSVSVSYLCACACMCLCVSAWLTAPQTPTCQDAHSGSSQLPTAEGLLDGSQKCSVSFSCPAPELQDTCLCLIPFPQVTRHWARKVGVTRWWKM